MRVRVLASVGFPRDGGILPAEFVIEDRRPARNPAWDVLTVSGPWIPEWAEEGQFVMPSFHCALDGTVRVIDVAPDPYGEPPEEAA